MWIYQRVDFLYFGYCVWIQCVIIPENGLPILWTLSILDIVCDYTIESIDCILYITYILEQTAQL